MVARKIKAMRRHGNNSALQNNQEKRRYTILQQVQEQKTLDQEELEEVSPHIHSTKGDSSKGHQDWVMPPQDSIHERKNFEEEFPSLMEEEDLLDPKLQDMDLQKIIEE